jgi:hypothetical protein
MVDLVLHLVLHTLAVEVEEQVLQVVMLQMDQAVVLVEMEPHHLLLEHLLPMLVEVLVVCTLEELLLLAELVVAEMEHLTVLMAIKQE